MRAFQRSALIDDIDERSAAFAGTREQLVAAGLVLPEWFPALPARSTYSAARAWRCLDEPTLPTFWDLHAQDDGVYMLVVHPVYEPASGPWDAMRPRVPDWLAAHRACVAQRDEAFRRFLTAVASGA